MENCLFKRAAVVFVFIAAFIPVTASAAQFRGDQSGSISINEAVSDDIYAAGSSVSLAAPVTGEAVLVGGNVLVSGAVSESVWAAGGTLTVLGNTADDVRVVGGNIMINGKTAHDVIALGGQINLSSSATVGKDLIVLGGTVTVDGPVNGNVYIRGGEVTINAPIGGSVDVKADTIVFGPKATIAGKLVYSSPKEATIASGVANGGVEYTKMENKNAKNAGGALAALLTIGFLIKLVCLLVLAIILTMIFKKRSIVLEQNAFKAFWGNLFYGFAASILVPIAALLLFITVIGSPVAIIVMCAYGILLAMSGIFAPVLVGGLIWKLVKKTPDYPINIYSILVGALVFGLAGWIPVVGWIFGLVFVLVALGALTRVVSDGLKTASQSR
jgi:hypothetical protein